MMEKSMAERQVSKTIDRLRLQVLRTDARQRLASSRLDRAIDEQQMARSAYEDAVTAYIAALEEMVDPA
jgi:hypothetical protein